MIDVTCAVIRNDEDSVLIVQRGEKTDHPFMWEFPGGKVREGESFEDCILREIDEELSLDIIIVDTLKTVEYDYGHKNIRLIPFICDTLMDLPVLHEHNDYKWVNVSELIGVDFLSADIPVSMEYAERFSANSSLADNKKDSIIEAASGIEEMLSEKSGFGSIDLIAGLAEDRPDIITLLMQFSLSSDNALAFRASYVLTKVQENAGNNLKPWYREIVEALPGLKTDSVIRSFLKIINLAGVDQLTRDDHGLLADSCFTMLNNGKSAIAVKAYSMEALYNLTQIYPELSMELSASITRNMEGGSAGIKARGRQILNKLSKTS